MRRIIKRDLPVFLVLFAWLAWFSPVAAAQNDPRLLCETKTKLVFPRPEDSPVLNGWPQKNLITDAHALDCAGLFPGDYNLYLTLAGSFRDRAAADVVLRRFGAISTLQGVRYWSVKDRGWQTLIKGAAAVTGPAGKQIRPDFSLQELKGGHDLFYEQQDNRSAGKVIYRLRVLDSGPDKLMIAMENITSVRFLLIPIFAPHNLQFLYIMQETSPGVWGYYNLTAVRGIWATPTPNGEKSYINRAVAMFRHIAGIPTDQNPPFIR
jgi:hypothetical protein